MTIDLISHLDRWVAQLQHHVLKALVLSPNHVKGDWVPERLLYALDSFRENWLRGRGQLLDKLDLLPRRFSNDMKNFNTVRNITIHERQFYYDFQESRLNENEFGDILSAGVRSVQELNDLSDMVAPDAAVQ